ncbi:MAG TPA: PIN domain-containing protein [Chloroflexota bacterium]|nr:PIN domain-containing protein [Chloroflexota bacterium]
MNVEIVLRIIGGILAGIAAFQLLANLVDLSRWTTIGVWLVFGGCYLSFSVGYLLTPYVTTRPFFWLRYRIYHASAGDVLLGGVGLTFGLLSGALMSFPLSFLPGLYGRVLPVIATAVLAYFGVMAMLAHEQGILATLGIGARAGRGAARMEGRCLLLDTSAIIDGRIADIARTGFLGGTLIVPRFVLEEIQHIADSPDAMRRNRGRRGLDVLGTLQKEATTPVEITDEDVENAIGVDAKLVRLAQEHGYSIITNDYNLNHVAQLQGIEVLNVNVLANAVRSVILQGEEISIRLIQEGKEPSQGVGYLEDGTMVVVENGRQFMGQTVDVVATKVLQTAAGRMVFARVKPPSDVARA